MTNQEMPHPPCLCALHIVRSPSPTTPESAIRGFAVFIVDAHPRSPSFESKVIGLPDAVPDAKAISHIANLLPRDAAVVIRQSQPKQPAADHLRRYSALPNPRYSALLRSQRPELNVVSFDIEDENLTVVTDYFRLTPSSRDAGLSERMARAGHDAQALWLAFLFSVTDRPSRRHLASAYQAWRVLRDAAPARFGSAERF